MQRINLKITLILRLTTPKNSNSTDNGPYASQNNINQGQRSGANYAKWIGGGLGLGFLEDL